MIAATSVFSIASAFAFVLMESPLHAQSFSDWEQAAGGKMSFDVASLKQNKSGPDGTISANMPLGPGDYYNPTGGLFDAVNLPLITYMSFAYKMTGSELQALTAELPKWAAEARFDIQARSSANPTKDQMRLMMQSLLADRFKLAIHSEIHQVPVSALVVVKEGAIGPDLEPHPANAECSSALSPTSDAFTKTVGGKFPVTCGGIQSMPSSSAGRERFGARNVTMAFLANSLTGLAELDHPVIDETGLTGAYDFSLEWVPETQSPTEAQSEPSGPTFLEALRDQLGLKLKATTGPVVTLVLDHIEEPSAN